MIEIAVLGLGARGTGYAKWLKWFFKSRARVVALCDRSADRLLFNAKRHNIGPSRCFLEADDFFRAGKLADAVFICSQDRDHYGHALKAIELGYEIMLEKPVSPVLAECLDIERRAREKGVRVVVCHLMRYMPLHSRLHGLVSSGRYGRVTGINHSENIGYFHFAHSYVRGDWHKEGETSPMILAKCCHDFDYLDWLMGGGCQSVSSIGALAYFTPENAPDGAAERCLDCPKAVRKRCPYDAERLYITTPLHKATFVRFMGDTVTRKHRFTKADLYEALKTGNYGRCVFHMDNDVCDRQAVLLDYGGGRVATLTATAFSKKFYRRIIVHLERAVIETEDYKRKIRVHEFGGKSRTIRIWEPQIVHLLGDILMVKNFLNLLDGAALSDATFVSTSIESHRLALLAEESRKQGGKRLAVKRGS